MKDKGKGLRISIFILFVFLALRYNFGNDYPSYYKLFYYLDYQGRVDAKIEIGYSWLCSFFRPIGFFSLIIFLSGLYCLSLYQTIKRYVPQKYYWLILMSIISNADLVFFGASAIRQTAAFSIFLFALPYLETKKPIPYFIIVFVASLFHQSALVFTALYPLMYLDLKNKKFVIVFGIITFAFMTILKVQFENIINMVAASNFEKYIERYGESKQTLEGGTIGIIIRVIFLLLFLWAMRFENNKIRSVFLILSIICITIFTIRNMVMLQRFTLYFGYMMSFSFAYILQLIKEKKKSIYPFVIAIILIWNINMAIVFASTPSSLFEYHTIFEHGTLTVSF